jgi:hypothetical protein
MRAAGRPYVMAVVALAGAGFVAVTPIAAPPEQRVTSTAVRLADASTELGDLTGLGSSFESVAGIDGDFTDLANLSGLTSLATGLGDITTSLNTGLGGFADGLGSFTSGLGVLGDLANVPYNVIADLANIPYNEDLALQEYGSALGPAANSLGVPGWIPPGATVADGGVNPAGVYDLGGTGSFYAESLGNTWGWDDGNFPQLDGIASFLVPFPSFEQPLVDDIQGVLQAEIVDGAAVNCEFECASWTGYVGGWFHQPLTELLSGTYTFPTVLEDTVGGTGVTSATGVINSGGTAGNDVIWSGQPFNLEDPLTSLAANLTGSPASNPIEIPNPEAILTNAIQLFSDINYDFNPFTTGSFLYWGAPTDYSIPAVIGGMLQNFTGIPNQFPLTDLGAEPLSGYTDGPSSLLTGLPDGLEYLANGLLGYLNPSTYLDALTNDGPGTLLGTLTDPAALLNDIPLLGLLVDTNALGGSLDTSALGGSLDASALSTDLSSALGSVDPSTLLGTLDPTAIAGDLSTMLSSGAADAGATLMPDLALNVLTSLF